MNATATKTEKKGLKTYTFDPAKYMKSRVAMQEYLEAALENRADDPKGIASALTSRLAIEILERGKVPFYCCAWSNLKSARNAIKSGFRPAWVEMTVKPTSLVNEMNK